METEWYDDSPMFNCQCERMAMELNAIKSSDDNYFEHTLQLFEVRESCSCTMEHVGE